MNTTIYHYRGCSGIGDHGRHIGHDFFPAPTVEEVLRLNLDLIMITR